MFLFRKSVCCGSILAYCITRHHLSYSVSRYISKCGFLRMVAYLCMRYAHLFQSYGVRFSVDIPIIEWYRIVLINITDVASLESVFVSSICGWSYRARLTCTYQTLFFNLNCFVYFMCEFLTCFICVQCCSSVFYPIGIMDLGMPITWLQAYYRCVSI